MTESYHTFEQVLDYAIDREINSRLYYLALAQKACSSELRLLLQRLADEELSHQKKLARVKRGQFKILNGDMPDIDLGIAGSLSEATPHADMSVIEALQVAMMKEKFAYRLYHELALAAESEELEEIFLVLAHEEANHKVRLEIEYDDLIQNET